LEIPTPPDIVNAPVVVDVESAVPVTPREVEKDTWPLRLNVELTNTGPLKVDVPDATTAPPTLRFELSVALPFAEIVPAITRLPPMVAVFATPMPPAVVTLPVVTLVLSLVEMLDKAFAERLLLTVTNPLKVETPPTVRLLPMFALRETPTPPDTVSAPVTVLTDSATEKTYKF
jgi:hypothetical protein